MRAWEKHLLGIPVTRLPALVPGVVVAAATVWIAMQIAGLLGEALLRAQGVDPTGKGSPVSAISVAVILGIAASNLFPLPAALAPGLEFSVKKLLRLGIILVGVKLSLVDVASRGLWGIPVVAIVIACALFAAPRIATLLGVGARLGTLTAAATGICGVTATVATAPVIGADDREVAYTVANVTLFGVIAMLVYPFLAHAIFATAPASAGLFLGTAIHDTSQVMGAALSYRDVFGEEVAFQVATVTKLTRNCFLVAVVPLLGWLHARSGGPAAKKPPLSQLFPLFVLGFLALAALRTAGDAGLAASAGIDAERWKALTKLLGDNTATALLATAMASVGLSTDLRSFRSLGLKPLWLGAISAVLVGAIGLALAAIVGRAA
jgi:uncharacterized integral membrane protein (TIGR00698 family)